MKALVFENDNDALLAESRQPDSQAGEAAIVLFERYFDRLLRPAMG
jgi:hypothetical protein